MNVFRLFGSLAFATILTIAPTSRVLAGDPLQGSDAETRVELDQSSRSIVQVQIRPGSPAFEWVRSKLAGQAPIAEPLALRVEYAEGFAPDDLGLFQSGVAQPTLAEAKNGLDLTNPPFPTGPGRTIGQRTTETEFCQSYLSVNGVRQSADIEFHYEWRKPRDSQGRVIEDAEPEWTLVGYTVKELMPLAASVC